MLTPPRAIGLLATALLVYFCAAEIATRLYLPRFSEILQREAQDHHATVRMRPTMSDGSKSVLFVGNSLLLDGIDRPRLTQEMGPAYHVVLYPVEGTAYLDWYFGLRRLFAEGTRPSLVILCLNATNLLSDATEGELFAHTLMRIEDLPAVVRAGHLDLMTASSYFFANLSALLADRSHLHNGLMSRWLPNANLLASALPIQHPTSPVMRGDSSTRGTERLRDVKELSAAYGAHFVFLVPPSLNRLDSAEKIRAAAGSAGISVLVPYAPGEMPPAAFSDSFHLNLDGAARFTDRVATALRRAETAARSQP